MARPADPPRVTKIRLLRSVYCDGDLLKMKGGDKPTTFTVGKGKQVSPRDARILVGEGAAIVHEVTGEGDAGPITAAAAPGKGGKGD